MISWKFRKKDCGYYACKTQVYRNILLTELEHWRPNSEVEWAQLSWQTSTFSTWFGMHIDQPLISISGGKLWTRAVCMINRRWCGSGMWIRSEIRKYQEVKRFEKDVHVIDFPESQVCYVANQHACSYFEDTNRGILCCRHFALQQPRNGSQVHHRW